MNRRTNKRGHDGGNDKVFPARNFQAKYRFIMDFAGTAPDCPHGPTLLFEKLSSGEQFFACSAYRDRKGCSFYRKFSDKQDRERRSGFSNSGHERKDLRQADEVMRLKLLMSLPRNQRHFCSSCSKFVTCPTALLKHSSHELIRNISLSALQKPTKLLRQQSNSKREAQYHFNPKSTKFICRALREKGLKRVICLGTTSVHEFIQKHRLATGMRTMLLDIDDRLEQFYPPSQFAHANFFNFHFFSRTGFRWLRSFVAKSEPNEIAIVIDPPFGGLMEALSATVLKIQSLVERIHGCQPSKLPILIVMPYFSEKTVLNAFPELYMADYKVSYVNHRKLKGLSSPVRLFTNIAGKDLKFPGREGYKFCQICLRYVSRENRHCDACSKCTAKDGKAAIHCAQCKKCVKETYSHCDKCGRCSLPHSHH